jgi:hypothetical protein
MKENKTVEKNNHTIKKVWLEPKIEQLSINSGIGAKSDLSASRS